MNINRFYKKLDMPKILLVYILVISLAFASATGCEESNGSDDFLPLLLLRLGSSPERSNPPGTEEPGRDCSDAPFIFQRVKGPYDGHRWSSMAYGNGYFVAVTESPIESHAKVMRSPNGIQLWSRHSSIDDAVQWKKIAFGNGLFVAIGINDLGISNIMTSPDGSVWTPRTNPVVDTEWTAVTYGDDGFVAVGKNEAGGQQVMTSPDGITWTPRTAPVGNPGGVPYGGDVTDLPFNWSSVTYGNGRFVAVAEGGFRERVMISTNGGATWTLQDPYKNHVWNFGYHRWKSIAFGNGTFVAVVGDYGEGGYRIMTSPDGINWTHHKISGWNHASDITFGDGLFVAVSGGGNVGGHVYGTGVITSPDGYNWTHFPIPPNTWREWSAVAFGDSRFVFAPTVSGVTFMHVECHPFQGF